MSTQLDRNILKDIPIVKLNYDVAGTSEHSGDYVGELVKVDRPGDQASRWSCSRNTPSLKSWILLQLETPAVLKSITFGKFNKVHPCNMKDCKVLVGMSTDHMSEVLCASLRNDTTPETFSLNSVNQGGVQFPTRYVKIIPLSSHGQSFNTSIWYIALRGISQPEYISAITLKYDRHREINATRHILKHLRQRRHITLYRSLIQSTHIPLEHPLVTQLYDALVLNANWPLVHETLSSFRNAGLYTAYTRACTPRAVWKRLVSLDDDGAPYAPSGRGGHAMCMDVENGLIYLFGGWDGQRSLDDFWVYDVKSERWKLICAHVGMRNGPGPRECHKMVFDPKTGSIYLLGRHSDDVGYNGTSNLIPTTAGSTSTSMGGTNSVSSGGSMMLPSAAPTGAATFGSRESTPVDGSPRTDDQNNNSNSAVPTASSSSGYFSEFYRYRTRGVDQGTWELLDFDTAAFNGPPLLYDHQLVIDSEAQVLYVQGGRVVNGETNLIKHSPLYSYNIKTRKWIVIQSPQTTTEAPIHSRFGHSMLFESNLNHLFIFAGKHESDYLSDMWEYDLDAREARKVFSNFTVAGGPEACFAHRAVVDVELREIYVFAGLTKNELTSGYLVSDASTVWLYRYDKNPGTWLKVSPYVEPSPRTGTDSPYGADAGFNSNGNGKERSVSSYNYSQGDTGNYGYSGYDYGYEAAYLTEWEPLPRARSAHQVVYDPMTKTVFLHGGNPGLSMGTVRVRTSNALGDSGGNGEPSGSGSGETRLDDFWSMTFKRPEPEEIVRKATLKVRCQQFRELSQDDKPIDALAFLQSDVSSIVNHSDQEEEQMFRALLAQLLDPGAAVEEERKKEESGYAEVYPERYLKSTRRKGGVGKQVENTGEDDVDMNGNSQDISVPPAKVLSMFDMEGEDGSSISMARFRQRTEVFESLLAYLNPNAVQPSENLLDMLDGSDL